MSKEPVTLDIGEAYRNIQKPYDAIEKLVCEIPPRMQRIAAYAKNIGMIVAGAHDGPNGKGVIIAGLVHNEPKSHDLVARLIGGLPQAPRRYALEGFKGTYDLRLSKRTNDALDTWVKDEAIEAYETLRRLKWNDEQIISMSAEYETGLRPICVVQDGKKILVSAQRTTPEVVLRDKWLAEGAPAEYIDDLAINTKQADAEEEYMKSVLTMDVNRANKSITDYFQSFFGRDSLFAHTLVTMSNERQVVFPVGAAHIVAGALPRLLDSYGVPYLALSTQLSGKRLF